MSSREGATKPSAASTIAAPRLEIIVEQEAGKPVTRSHTLDGDEFRIGASPKNDVVIDDPQVSRFHCSLARELGRWKLRDTGSLNGTRLGNVSVRDVDLVMPECVIELGESRLRIRERLSAEQTSVLEQTSFGALYGRSQPMQKLFATLERVAKSDVNVLVEGESGTGKELVAGEISRRSARADAPLVVIDCGALPETILEGILFGHVRGAFTGADRDKEGAFESADGGTVFLDEIGELPLAMQPKLLRVLESRTVQRLGDPKARRIDVRVIAATNRELEREVNQGRFREDLYFRLAVLTVRIPPLRARPDDIELLVRRFLQDRAGGEELFSPAVLAQLVKYSWPGNVRELKNYVERATVLHETPPLGPKPTSTPDVSAKADLAEVDIDVPFKLAKESLLDAFERAYVERLLAWSGGNVTKAAAKAGLDRVSIHRLLGRHGVKPSRQK